MTPTDPSPAEIHQACLQIQAGGRLTGKPAHQKTKDIPVKTTSTEITRNVWNGIQIPAEFEPVYRPTVRRLQLKLASERLRRKWEFEFWVHRSKKQMIVSLFVLPREYRSTERLDLSKLRVLEVSLLHPRASVWHGEHFLTLNAFRHDEGLQVLDATLRTLSEQLRDQA